MRNNHRACTNWALGPWTRKEPYYEHRKSMNNLKNKVFCIFGYLAGWCTRGQGLVFSGLWQSRVPLYWSSHCQKQNKKQKARPKNKPWNTSYFSLNSLIPLSQTFKFTRPSSCGWEKKAHWRQQCHITRWGDAVHRDLILWSCCTITNESAVESKKRKIQKYSFAWFKK